MITVTVINWHLYNPRADRANHTWFRFQNNLFTDQKLFGLSDTTLSVWIWILCSVSEQGKDQAEINVQYFSAIRKKTESEIMQSIHELTKLGVITTASRRQDAVTPAESLPTTNERTDVTNERNERTVSTVVQRTPIAQPQNVQELFLALPQDVLERWATLYQDQEFLSREAIKAWGYYRNNPKKTPKSQRGWIQALSSWYERGWTWRAKNTPGAVSGPVDIAALRAELS